MVSTILVAISGLAVAGICLKIAKWRANYRVASKANFPTFYSPVHLTDAWWMVFTPILVPILDRLPKSWTQPWLPLAQALKVWNFGYRPYEETGSETIMLATPNGNIMWSCDTSIASQLLLGWPKCGVPVDVMGFFDIWGPTLGSVEGETWKTHRRVVTSGFSTSINATVWAETQKQATAMIRHWVDKEHSVISVMRHTTSRLALHVLCCGFFNMSLDWDGNEVGKTTVNPEGHGHRIRFDQALFMVLERLGIVYMMPRPLLAILPIPAVQEAHLAFTEITKYFKELRAGADSDLEKLAKKRDKTLLEAIVLSGADPEIAGKKALPEESILGNIFFTVLAGHETVGSTLAFICQLMAIYPEIQTQLQQGLDQQLGDRPPSEWSIEHDYASLQKGYLGAIQKETLCLYNPAGFTMRKTFEDLTVVDSQGITHVIPANTFTPVPFAAIFRSPALWKRPAVSDERRKALSDSSVLYFNPDRWLGTDDKPDEQSRGDNHGYPIWYGFGQGPRSCPGRAFAQTEMTATMATLFKDYSLELVVDAKTLAVCGGNETKAWEMTRDKAIKMLQDDITLKIGITLEKELPIRVVKRKV